MDEIILSDGTVIPERELVWRFDTSGGPGGQHANRSATRAELSLDVRESEALPDAIKERIIGALGSRLRNGVITVSASESRSQWRNRAVARRRMVELLNEALRPVARRRPTKPSRAARRRRIEGKRRRSAIKRLRRPPEPE